MEDLSLHILDIAENSLRAKATEIVINIEENMEKDFLKIEIKDNGKGMTSEEINKATDPFYTTKKGKKTGIGISLLAQSVKETEGKFEIESNRDSGTKINATLKHSHIDRKPLGDISKTIIALIASNPEIDFIFAHTRDKDDFSLDTKEIKKELGDIKINSHEVLNFIKKGLNDFYSVSS